MKIQSLSIALLLTVFLFSCKKEEVAEQPPINTLTNGTWNVVGLEYTFETPGNFITVPAEKATLSGTVNFTFDSIYHNVSGMGIAADSAGNPMPIMISDSRHGPYTILDDERFTVVDLTTANILTYEGMARSENSMHLRYDIKSQVYVSLDSIVQLKETYIMELSR